MSEQVTKRTGSEILESMEGILTTIARTTQPAIPRKKESDGLKEFYKALGSAQKKFRDIEKSGLIGGRNIRYAKINDLVDASREALSTNDLVVSTFHVTYPNGLVTLVTRLFHTQSGQYTESELPLLNGTDEQKRGSSITYAWRYTYAPLLGLVDNSYDDDGEEAITKPNSHKK